MAEQDPAYRPSVEEIDREAEQITVLKKRVDDLSDVTGGTGAALADAETAYYQRVAERNGRFEGFAVARARREDERNDRLAGRPVAPPSGPASGAASGPVAAAGGRGGGATGHGIDLYRSYCRQVTAEAARRIEAEQAAIAEADATLAAHERVAAQLAAYKIGPQTAGGMVELVDAAKARKAAAQTAMAAAERARAAAEMNVRRLTTGGHDHTAAAVQAVTGPPAPTSWYQR